MNRYEFENLISDYLDGTISFKDRTKIEEYIKLNPEEFPLVLIGSIDEGDDLYQIAYKYIRNVSIVSFKKMNYFKNKNTKHFTILNSYR